MSEPILKVEKATKAFPGVRALDNVDFELLPGEVHVIAGEKPEIPRWGGVIIAARGCATGAKVARLGVIVYSLRWDLDRPLCGWQKRPDRPESAHVLVDEFDQL